MLVHFEFTHKSQTTVELTTYLFFSMSSGCIDFSFVWFNKRAPYLVNEITKKIIRLRVTGNIPYLVPGDPYCQPEDPSAEYPLLDWIVVRRFIRRQLKLINNLKSCFLN